MRNRRVVAHVEPAPERLHERLAIEELGKPLRVARSGGGLGVVLGELQGGGQDERIGARGGTGGRTTGIDRGETPFGVAQPEVVHQGRALERHAGHAFAQAPQGFGGVGDAGLLGEREEKWPEKGTEQPSAEGQSSRPHAVRL